jgi:hypothetical protein
MTKIARLRRLGDSTTVVRHGAELVVPVDVARSTPRSCLAFHGVSVTTSTVGT